MMCCGCESPFENTLHYTSPAHGGWGVVRMGHLMPESYQLFVSPAACGRHGAVSACMQGRKNRVSYLHLSEDDIVSGGYEDLILAGTDELVAYLKRAGRMPRVLMIFVSCIDDLLGTDLEALQIQLEEKHPELRFAFCHMNPTTLDTGVPPPVNIRNKLYEFLDKSAERDGGVNLIGSLVPLDPESEIFRVLPKMGAEPVRHITDYHTFDTFQEMAKSRLNLVLEPAGEYAARQMQKKHGIPYRMVLASYEPRQVSADYGEIAKCTGGVLPSLSEYEKLCEEAMEKTRSALGGMPVVIDGEGIPRPFSLAKALLLRGFSVQRMVVQQVIPTDREAYEWVRGNYSQLSLEQPQHHRALLRENGMTDCLAIGFSSAYLTGSRHIVPLDGQNGHWGYRGILTLMDEMQKAAAQERDLRALVEDAGLVV